MGWPPAPAERVSAGVVRWRATARRGCASAHQRSCAGARRRADRQSRSRSRARYHEPLSRYQCPGNDGARGDARSRADSSRRAPHGYPRTGPHRRGPVRALSYFLEEAALSLWRRRGASILAAGTSAVSLMVLGLFLLAGSNASRVIERWSSAAELSVYLTERATNANRTAIERALTSSGLDNGH